MEEVCPRKYINNSNADNHIHEFHVVTRQHELSRQCKNSITDMNKKKEWYVAVLHALHRPALIFIGLWEPIGYAAYTATDMNRKTEWYVAVLHALHRPALIFIGLWEPIGYAAYTAIYDSDDVNLVLD